MGEIIEFTTFPQLKNLYYSINSNGINFEIKGSNDAGVGLSTKMGPTPDITVSLGQRTLIFNSTENQRNESGNTPNLLDSEEYRRFWLSWHNGIVSVGRDGERTAIVSCGYNISNLRYVTFAALGQSPLHWRIELPPERNPPVLKPIKGGELYWVPVNADTPFPADAFIGGFEEENLYIIRAPHRGSLTPGKYMSSKGVGYVGFFWEMHPKDTFEVLCGCDCIWVPTSGAKIPVGAVVGGHDESHCRENLYIARVEHKGHMIVGKVHPSHSVCYIPYDGKEVRCENYEILVVPGANKAANKFLIPHNPHRTERLDNVPLNLNRRGLRQFIVQRNMIAPNYDFD